VKILIKQGPDLPHHEISRDKGRWSPGNSGAELSPEVGHGLLSEEKLALAGIKEETLCIGWIQPAQGE